MNGTGMTISEKILAAHGGRERVRAGETVRIEVDLVLDDSDGAAAAERGAVRPGMTVLCGEAPATGLGALGCSASVAGQDALQAARLFGQATVRVPATVKCLLLGERPAGVHGTDIGLSILSRLGRESTAGRALEFGGEVLSGMSIPSRLSLCATATAGGACTGIVPADGVTFRYVCARATGSFASYESDSDARFDSTIEIDVGAIEPMVALADVVRGVPVGTLKPVRLSRAILGPGAMIEDLRVAAAIVRGRRVAEGVVAVVVPATGETLQRAEGEGLLDLLRAAGWEVLDPAGPLPEKGGPTPSPEESMTLSTVPGGGSAAQPGPGRIAIASPLTVAASAVQGFVTDPRPFLPAAGDLGAGPTRDDRPRQERQRERGTVITAFPRAEFRKEAGRSIQP